LNDFNRLWLSSKLPATSKAKNLNIFGETMRAKLINGELKFQITEKKNYKMGAHFWKQFL